MYKQVKKNQRKRSLVLFLNSCLPLLNASIKPFICGILIQNSILSEFDGFMCFFMTSLLSFHTKHRNILVCGLFSCFLLN
uniref:Uncharacterized protein n=1 Tax=Helianthus annuus TaxID=4232 RepID=A0A251UYH3_HELAN